MTSEAALGSSLSGRVASQGPSIEHSGQVDTARIFSEYLRSTKSPKIPGSKCGYGSQASVKRRRTVCYLMTGIPARIPALDMIELNIKTALGALRVLNWPEGSS
ncbi:MAG: hypothetical protein EOO82_03605 [Oxalobacteraceae bacterium]|nr:MAG: hypothetical protein EOO82_03605 [Oxalobacteraceae bacterium]